MLSFCYPPSAVLKAIRRAGSRPIVRLEKGALPTANATSFALSFPRLMQGRNPPIAPPTIRRGSRRLRVPTETSASRFRLGSPSAHTPASTCVRHLETIRSSGRQSDITPLWVADAGPVERTRAITARFRVPVAAAGGATAPSTARGPPERTGGHGSERARPARAVRAARTRARPTAWRTRPSPDARAGGPGRLRSEWFVRRPLGRSQSLVAEPRPWRRRARRRGLHLGRRRARLRRVDGRPHRYRELAHAAAA